MEKQAKRFGRRYPWEEWFAQGQFVLIPGRDYDTDVQPWNMAQMVRTAASRFGLSASVQIFGHGQIRVEVASRENISGT